MTGKPKTSGWTNYDGVLDVLGAAALLLLGAGALLSVAPANVALALLLLLVLLDVRRAGPIMMRSWFFWVSLAYVAFLVMEYLVVCLQGRPWQAHAGAQTVDYIKIGWLAALVVGYWFARLPWLKVPVLALIPAGLLARVPYKMETVSFERVIVGTDRLTFGDTAVNFGLWALVALIIGVALLRSAFARTGSKRWLLCLYLIAVIVLGLLGVFFSLTRAVWIAALFTVPVAMALTCWPYASRGRRVTLVIAVIACVVACVMGLRLLFPDIVAHRLLNCADVLAAIYQGRWSQMPMDSVGVRLRMFWEAWHYWLERPAIGHGPGSASVLLARVPYQAIATRGFEHFHNMPLNVLATYGIVGFAFIIGLFAYAMGSLWRCVTSDSSGVAVACFVGLGAVAVASMSGDPISGYRGPFIVAVLFGIAASSHFATFLAQRSAEPGVGMDAQRLVGCGGND